MLDLLTLILRENRCKNTINRKNISPLIFLFDESDTTL